MNATSRRLHRYPGMTFPTLKLSPVLTLTWHHGGGHVHGVAYWRWRGRLVAVVVAGQA